MTFEEAYSALEDDFRQRVEEDKQSGVKCIFLPNVEPIGPVDYVLVGMEPSLGDGRWAMGDGRGAKVNPAWRTPKRG